MTPRPGTSWPTQPLPPILDRPAKLPPHTLIERKGAELVHPERRSLPELVEGALHRRGPDSDALAEGDEVLPADVLPPLSVEGESQPLFHCPAELAPYMPGFRYELTELSAMQDEQIRGGVLLRVALLAMRHVFDDDLPERIPRIARLLGTVVGTRSGLRALEALLRYLASASEVVGEEELRNGLREAFPEQGDRLMASVVDKWIEQGMERGIQQGIEQGIQQGTAVMAREALLDVLHARFGEVPEPIVRWAASEADVDLLRNLLRNAATVGSFEEFQAAVERESEGRQER